MGGWPQSWSGISSFTQSLISMHGPHSTKGIDGWSNLCGRERGLSSTDRKDGHASVVCVRARQAHDDQGMQPLFNLSQSQLIQFRIQRLPMDAQDACRFRLIAGPTCQSAGDENPFERARRLFQGKCQQLLQI